MLYVCFGFSKPKTVMSKKLTFVLSDESLNRHGFRVITDGIDTSSFEANPIMLYMHKRDMRWNESNMLPIGTWANIRKEDGKLMADAIFDDDDPEAVKIKKKVEKGILRMASISIETVEMSEAPEHIIQGQSRATVTRCEINEASIVDIGSNRNALRLYKEGKYIELSADNINDFIPTIKLNQKPQTMKKIAILLSLTNAATEAEIEAAVQNLLTKNQDAATQLAAKDTEITNLKNQIDLTQKEKVTSLVSNAVTSKKITEADRKTYEDLAAKDFDLAKRVLDGMPGVEKVVNQLGSPAAETQKLNWDELHKTGKLEELKAKQPEVFKQLYKEKFNKEYKD